MYLHVIIPLSTPILVCIMMQLMCISYLDVIATETISETSCENNLLTYAEGLAKHRLAHPRSLTLELHCLLLYEKKFIDFYQRTV